MPAAVGGPPRGQGGVPAWREPTVRRRALYLAAGLAAGIVGAGLISLPAQHYRVELTSCANWPAPLLSWGLSAVYLLAVGLLTLCWLGWWTAAPRFRTALGAGIVVHAVVLLAPPYLSLDPLFYAAIGRALAKFHGSAYVPLRSVLPPGDPILSRLSIDWQSGTSAYFPGWNELTRAVAVLGGESLTAQLRLYQLLGLLTMAAAAGIAGLAAEEHQAGSAGRAVAAVLLCPLAVIEATQAAHNDHLLALAVALFALATARRRPVLGLVAIALGLLVKASAVLFLGIALVAFLASRFRLTFIRLAIVAAALIGGAVVFAAPLYAQLARFTPLLGGAVGGPLYCARAVECIPRYLLYRAHYFVAGWGVGAAFRVTGALWLLYAGVRGGLDGRILPWSALGIFIYYTYLHAYWQGWYLLPLLPLLPFAGRRARPAMIAACVSSVGYYAVVLPFNCLRNPNLLLLESVLEAAIILAPPTVCLWWSYRRSRR